MIVVDTSALIAIIAAEAEAEPFARLLEQVQGSAISTGTALELSIVARRKLGTEGWERVRMLIAELKIAALPFDEPQLQIATEGYALYGRGSGHPAQLNYGDCFAYALAKSLDVPLLYKGDDFVHTDIRPAIEPR